MMIAGLHCWSFHRGRLSRRTTSRHGSPVPKLCNQYFQYVVDSRDRLRQCGTPERGVRIPPHPSDSDARPPSHVCSAGLPTADTTRPDPTIEMFCMPISRGRRGLAGVFGGRMEV